MLVLNNYDFFFLRGCPYCQRLRHLSTVTMKTIYLSYLKIVCIQCRCDMYVCKLYLEMNKYVFI